MGASEGPEVQAAQGLRAGPQMVSSSSFPLTTLKLTATRMRE